MTDIKAKYGRIGRKISWCMRAMFMSYSAFPAIAEAETTTGATVSASSAFDTNPFLGIANDQQVASFRLELLPRASISDEMTNYSLQARVEHVEYLGKYNSVQNGSAGIAAKHRYDARTTISANIAIASNVSLSGTSFAQSGLAPQADLLPPDLATNDFVLLGKQTRRNSLTAGAVLAVQPRENEELSFSSTLNLQRYSGSSDLGDYDYSAQAFSYTRAINNRLSIGSIFEAARGNFKNTRSGDAIILSPRFMVRARISDKLQANGSLGGSFTRVNTLSGKRNITTFSGSASVCYRQLRDNLCLTADRQVLPTALGGLRTQTALGTNYSLKLSNRDSFQLATSYTVASAPLNGGSNRLESLRTFGRFDRRLNERAGFNIIGAYISSSDATFIKRNNVQALIGITYNFGKI